MVRSWIGVACAALTVSAGAAQAQSDVRVSCYRGPWKQVIWDRANPDFIASLEVHGLSAVDARVIADSICRDPRLVNNPEGLAGEVRRVLSRTRRD